MGDAIVSEVRSKLFSLLESDHVEVDDMSDGCGAKLKVLVVSKKFEGMPLLDRHRLVQQVLQDELKHVHALTQKTLTPAQWDAAKQKSSAAS